MAVVLGSIQHAYRPEAEWQAWDGVPLTGQICYSNDVFYGGTNSPQYKVGNGVDTWTNLDYHPSTAGTLTGANNGLHLDGTNVQLGTTALSENTTIPAGAFDYKVTSVPEVGKTAEYEASQNLFGLGINGQGNRYVLTFGGGGQPESWLFQKVSNDTAVGGTYNSTIGYVNLATGVECYFEVTTAGVKMVTTDGTNQTGFNVTQVTEIIEGIVNGVTKMTIDSSGVAINNLAGGGSQMVTVSNTGLLGAQAIPSGGITQLTGDITAGPGSGSQVATLPVVNANVGSFTNASITVNAKGQVTAASSGSGSAQDCIVLDSFVSNVSSANANYFIQHRSTLIPANTIAAGDIIEVVAGLYKSVSSGDTTYYVFLSSSNTPETGAAANPYNNVTATWGWLLSFGVTAFAQAAKISYSWNTGGNQYIVPSQNVFDPYTSGATAGIGSAGTAYNGTLDFTSDMYINWVTLSTNSLRVRGFDYGIAKLYKQ